jgi:hypothetical protein
VTKIKPGDPVYIAGESVQAYGEHGLWPQDENRISQCHGLLAWWEFAHVEALTRVPELAILLMFNDDFLDFPRMGECLTRKYFIYGSELREGLASASVSLDR